MDKFLPVFASIVAVGKIVHLRIDQQEQRYFRSEVDLIMKIILWGAGAYGDRIFKRLGDDNVVAYIDSNPMKIGSKLHGKDIISLDDYIKKYRGIYIIISMLTENDIGRRLEEKGIYSFFNILDCPSEYYSPENFLDLVRRKIFKQTEINKVCYIYGDNFFAIDIASYIVKCGRNVVIVLPPYVKEERVEALKTGFPELEFTQVNSNAELTKYKSKIFVANGWDYRLLTKDVKNDFLVNIFETYEYLSENHNPDLIKYKNCHLDESCFIIGNGPSLCTEDLSLLKKNNIVSFGVNNINRIFSETDWRPTYFVMCDFYCFKNSDFTSPEEYSEICSFISDGSKAFWDDNKSEKNIKYHGIYWSSSLMETRFSDDIVKGMFLSSTVIYVCMQIAAYMGFKNIFLIGNDFFDPQNSNKSFAHFFEEKVKSLPSVSQFIKDFTTAREYAEKNSINIYNATRGGFLEVFDRVDFDSLFKNGKFIV